MQKGASDIWLMAHGTEDFADMMTIDHTPSVLGGCLGGCPATAGTEVL
jgi:hypothetical protein